MKIRKNSWHYTLVYRMVGLGNIPSDSLCIYFWQLVTSIMVVIGATLFMTISLITLGAVGVWLLSWPVLQHYQGIDPVYSACSAVVWIGISVLWLLYYREKYTKACRDRDMYGTKIPWYLRSLAGPKIYGRESEPSIFLEYLRAKKQKVCPKLEFIDD